MNGEDGLEVLTGEEGQRNWEDGNLYYKKLMTIENGVTVKKDKEIFFSFEDSEK